jgi:hypothetical protein
MVIASFWEHSVASMQRPCHDNRVPQESRAELGGLSRVRGSARPISEREVVQLHDVLPKDSGRATDDIGKGPGQGATSSLVVAKARACTRAPQPHSTWGGLFRRGRFRKPISKSTKAKQPRSSQRFLFLVNRRCLSSPSLRAPGYLDFSGSGITAPAKQVEKTPGLEHGSWLHFQTERPIQLCC